MYGNPTWGAQEGFYVCGGEGESLEVTVLGFHSAKLQLKECTFRALNRYLVGMVSITQEVGTSPLTVWFLEPSRVDGSSPTYLSKMQRREDGHNGNKQCGHLMGGGKAGAGACHKVTVLSLALKVPLDFHPGTPTHNPSRACSSIHTPDPDSAPPTYQLPLPTLACLQDFPKPICRFTSGQLLPILPQQCPSPSLLSWVLPASGTWIFLPSASLQALSSGAGLYPRWFS